MISQPVGIITRAEQQRAIAPLVTAFSNDPVTRWAFPDPQQYLASFPEFANHFGGAAFDCGTAYCADDFMATALWLPSGVEPDEDALGALLETTVPEGTREALFALIGQMGECRPADPHWYLPLIGVDPRRQGRGYGSALLEHALTRCDAEHVPAYLESTNERNVPLYERHGFEVMTTLQVGDSPPLWPMLREAR